MSGGNKIRDDAVRLIGEAVELDKQSKFGEALAKYTQAIEYFLHLIKCACTRLRSLLRFPVAITRC